MSQPLLRKGGCKEAWNARLVAANEKAGADVQDDGTKIAAVRRITKKKKNGKKICISVK